MADELNHKEVYTPTPAEVDEHISDLRALLNAAHEERLGEIPLLTIDNLTTVIAFLEKLK